MHARMSVFVVVVLGLFFVVVVVFWGVVVVFLSLVLGFFFPVAGSQDSGQPCRVPTNLPPPIHL